LHKQLSVIAALLVLSFGFTTAFADSGISSDLDVQTNPMLYDRPFSLDQIQVFTSLDFQDSTANILAIFLLAVPFGLIVYRMSDHDPIPVQTVKLSSVVVFFAMVSMLSMPLTTGNSLWGYAYASSESFENIPTPVNSLYFDFSDNSYSSDNILTILDDNNSALSLDGKSNHIVIDSGLPEKLEHFTISTWVKPDYKAGSASELSVASEAEAFELSINNDGVDKHYAKFSVFDGIKWHSVQSKSAITQNWTHLAATYSGNTIKIFVNGLAENSVKTDLDSSINYDNGIAELIEFDYISSKSDVLIGAFNPSIREESATQHHFSGLVDEITLYDKLLTATNISDLYQNNRTPDVVPVLEFAPLEIKIEPTGTSNEFGFVTDEDNPNDQKIESSASKGFKVEKKEDKKKKPAETETPTKPETTQVTTSSDSSTETNSESLFSSDIDQNQEIIIDDIGILGHPPDHDSDGVPNSKDLCFDTPPGAEVDEDGCADGEIAGEGGEPGSHSADVWQCQNGQIDDVEPCVNNKQGNTGYANWVKSKVGDSDSHWAEGDFLPYRGVIKSIQPGKPNVVEEGTNYIHSNFSFDTAKAADKKHAIDYLSAFNLTESNKNMMSIDENGIAHYNSMNVCEDFFDTGCDPLKPNATSKCNFSNPNPNSRRTNLQLS
jgi:hypothetical protein